MPAAASFATAGRKASRWPAASRPPSVVRSARRSGTMQTACGRTLQAISTISAVAAISILSGFVDGGLQPHDVVIDDVAAIFAQVRGDAVGSGRDRNFGGLHRIRMPAAARIAHGGDVIDVDAEADGTYAHGAASRLFNPVLDFQIGNASKFAFVVGNQCEVQGQSVGGNPKIVRANHFTSTGKVRPDRAIDTCGLGMAAETPE